MLPALILLMLPCDVIRVMLPALITQDSGSLSDASSGVGDTAAMRELDALNQEIEELRREKESLTTEIQQKELAIRSTDHDVQVRH